MIKKYGDIISGIAIFIFSVIVYFNTYTFKMITLSKIGSAFMPQLVAIFIGVLSIFVIINGVRTSKTIEVAQIEEKDGEKSEKISLVDRFSVVITFALIALYIALLDSLGFIIVTAVYLFAQIYVLSYQSQRRLWLNALLSVSISLGIYCVFVYAFKLVLPSGILG